MSKFEHVHRIIDTNFRAISILFDLLENFSAINQIKMINFSSTFEVILCNVVFIQRLRAK